jgi:hypothetical protein
MDLKEHTRDCPHAAGATPSGESFDRGCQKTEEGRDHPDRDAQFRHIHAAVKRALRAGAPVIPVDTKKKELLGNFQNPGQQWRPAKQPRPVQTHEFPAPDVPRAFPYGI